MVDVRDELFARAEQLADIDPSGALEMLQGEADPAVLADHRADAILARIHMLRSEPDRCELHAQRALADRVLDPHHRALAAEALGASVLYLGRDITAAVQVLERAIDEVGPVAGARLAARLAQVHLYRLDTVAMDRTAKAVVGLSLPVSARLRLAACRALLVAHSGRTSLAVSLSDPLPAMAAAAFRQAPLEALEAMYMTTFVRLFAGDLPGSQVLIDEVAHLGQPRLASLVDLMHAFARYEAGELAESVEAFERSLAGDYGDTTGFLPIIASAAAAQAQAQLGKAAEARASLERLPKGLRHELPVLASFVTHAEATLLTFEDRRDEATLLMMQHAARSLARDLHLEALRTLHLAHCLGAAASSLMLIERIRVDGPAPKTMLEHLLAVRDGDPVKLRQVARRFEQLGMVPRSVQALADAERCRA